MTQRYEKTSHYWNDIYEKQDAYNPKETVFDDTLESAINWISQKGGTTLDFGSGDGKMLLRCLEKGSVKTIGVDLSFHAISLARRTASSCYESLRTKWIWGDVKSLFPLPDACAESIILSHILDQIHPDDGEILLRSAHRLLDKKGRLLLILGPYKEQSEIKSQHLNPLLTDEGEAVKEAYVSPEGLYNWNLSDEKILSLLTPNFTLVEQMVFMPDNTTKNRMYFFELKN